MKRLLAGFIAGIVLASVGVASAGSYVLLHRHQTVFYGRIACVGGSRGTIVCLQNKQGYNVEYARDHIYLLHGTKLVWTAH